jgi:hypothetical protein
MIQFYQFGRSMHTVAIATAVALIPPITPFAGIIAIIFIFSALGDIKAINYQLYDTNLYLFRKRYIRGFIYKLISIIFVVGGAIVLGINLSTPSPDTSFMIVDLPIPITFMVTGLILFVVGSTVEAKAWVHLKIYFMTNKLLFPEPIRHKLIQGCDNLRKGALFWAIGIFIIPAIIGWVVQGSGFFNLAKLIDLTYYEPTVPQTRSQVYSTPQIDALPPTQDYIENNIYCPNCGSKLREQVKFCPECGSYISFLIQ